MKPKTSPSMPFYGKDAYGSKRFNALSFCVQGFYFYLAWWQWQDGSIPAEVDSVLAELPRGKVSEARKLWPSVIIEFPVMQDNTERRQNPQLEQIRNGWFGRKGKYQLGASMTNAKRWGSDIASGSLSDSPSDTDSESPRAAWGNAKALDLDFDSDNAQLVSSWTEAIGRENLNEILLKYPDKPAAYISAVVHSRVKEIARTAVQMRVGATPQRSDEQRIDQIRDDASLCRVALAAFAKTGKWHRDDESIEDARAYVAHVEQERENAKTWAEWLKSKETANA